MLWRLAIAAALIMATGGAVGAALHRWRRADAVVPESAAAGRGRAVAGGASSPPAAAPGAGRGGAGGVSGECGRRGLAGGASVGGAGAESCLLWNRRRQRWSRQLQRPLRRLRPRLALHRGGTAPSRPRPRRSRWARRSSPMRSATCARAATRRRRCGRWIEYDRRFPNGVLRAESRVARVEALLLLDRRAEALQLLEAIGPGGALTRDVRVTRGELLLERDRCADAVRDFDAVLAARDGDPAGGRALYGRASCRLRGGDVPGARADLTRYLSLHADGPSAAAARRALVALP